MCPGTVAGVFDPDSHKFVNQPFDKVRTGMISAISGIRKVNPQIKIILTVSPVPLTATASGRHVLVATTYSKSVLRAVAGQLADNNDHIDYFPSYEIITGTPFGGVFFDSNKRSVHAAGVDFVMRMFFSAMHKDSETALRSRPGAARGAIPADAAQHGSDAEEVCEEALLDAFGARP
jgi:hypothetical protein